MERLITVIVPVYNTKCYLSACLDSLLAQSYSCLEVILVDDGSTDGSGELCDRFAEQDARISVIHQKNAGVSAARNAALERAKGDYLFFLDSDDALPPESLKRLCGKMCGKALAAGSIQEISAEGVPGKKSLILPDEKFTADRMLHLLFHEEEQGYQGYLCNKLFDSEVIKQHRIRFCPEIRYNEDRLFITEYLLHCDHARFVSEVVYWYRQHESSALAKVHLGFKKAMLTELEAFERMFDLLEQRHPALAFRVARLTFEKALYWINRIPADQKSSRKYTRGMIRANAKRCLKEPGTGMLDKLKIIGHCVIER